MSKRKMPKHIVLPNGMWRFVKSGAKAVTRTRSKAKRKRTRGVSHMARRRRSSGRSSSPRGIMKGLYTPKGILASALIGAGAATLAEKFLPQVIPYQGPAIGFVVGGVGGAAGAFARDLLKGNITGTNTAGGYTQY